MTEQEQEQELEPKRKLPTFLWLPPLIALAVVALVVYGSRKQAERAAAGLQYALEGIMGTAAHITIVPTDRLTVPPQKAADLAFAAMRRAEGLMNMYDPRSDVGRVNACEPGQKVAVDPLTWLVLMEALRFNALSDGAFDPAVGGLMRIYRWNSPQERELPPQENIAATLAEAGVSNLLFEREGMLVGRRSAGTLVDLGGIAKGFGVDLAAQALLDAGVENAIVEIGGEVRILGSAPETRAQATQRIGGKGMPWVAGIRDPRRPEVLKTIATRDNQALATSGDYMKFFEIDGKRYSHIIDPRTGLPVSGGVISATVLYPGSGMRADALATIACVLGVERFREVLSLFPQAEAYLVEDGGGLVHIPAQKPAESRQEPEDGQPLNPQENGADNAAAGT